MPREEQLSVLRLWTTGEPAKTFILQRLSELMATWSDGPSKERGPVEEMITQCYTDVLDRSCRGEFVEPNGLLLLISDLMQFGRFWDEHQVMQTPHKRRRLQEHLRALLLALKGSNARALSATLQTLVTETDQMCRAPRPGDPR